MEEQQGNIDLNYVVPVITTDGNIVVISDQGVPTLLFFQGRGQNDNIIKADVVAAARLNGLEDLKSLSKAILETIEKHEKREV